jgi:uncharacterized protein YdaU (DUF1376 family)
MKSPAFQFYPTDYLGSQRVQMMTLEEEGAYCRLLWSCWQHGSIPSDPELAARLVGKGCSTTVARVVLQMFEIACGEGRLTHDRLEMERAKQADWREKSSAGGRKSAAIRQSKSKGGSRVVKPPYQPNGNIPSPSPSPSPSPDSATDTVSKTPKSPPAADASHPWEGDWRRLGKLFRRRESTQPTPKELKALKAITPIPDEDFKLIESYYNFSHQPAADYRRRDLQTLLNNWPGELDRARRFRPSGAISTIPGEHESILKGIEIYEC